MDGLRRDIARANQVGWRARVRLHERAVGHQRQADDRQKNPKYLHLAPIRSYDYCVEIISVTVPSMLAFAVQVFSTLPPKALVPRKVVVMRMWSPLSRGGFKPEVQHLVFSG